MLVDLSLPVGPGTAGVSYRRWTHERGHRIISRRARRLPGDGFFKILRNYVLWLGRMRVVRPEDLPDRCFLSNEFFSLSVHTGTHIDAPFHYGPMSEGTKAKKVLEVPLELLHAPGVIIDGTRAGRIVTRGYVRKRLDELRIDSLEGVIPLLRTDLDLVAGTSSYHLDSVALAPSAIDELLDRGAKVVGTDSWSLDAPARDMLERYFKTGDGSCLWPTHMHGRQREFIAIECLANLRSLPSSGFVFSAFPVALREAGGSWTRAVAELPDQ